MSSQENRPIKRIVIVGGGSAGWITAGLLASEFTGAAKPRIDITLIESPDVRTIGVGEGTWPTMRATLQKIGIGEAEFLAACSAGFKQGTQFVGWVDGSPDDRYYHPFSVPAGYPVTNLVPHWQEHREKVSFADAVGVQGYLCDRGLAPKQVSTPGYAGVVNYGYHLDADKFALLLRDHCIRQLGIQHLVDHVTGVDGEPDANIRSVSTKKSGSIEGDLFIDCTGFAALLLGGHYGIPYQDCKHILFNDRALAAQVAYPSTQSPIASQTNSTARSAGWIWDIALSSRRGIGYTYSSDHASDEQAEHTLRQYLADIPGIDAGAVTTRRITFRPGHRKKFWHHNCVAVGLSAGFLEPLEASALVLVELAASRIAEELPEHAGEMELIARRFNEKFLYRWERIIDFLKLHYVLSRRSDSAFWEDNRRGESISDSLRELLELWRYHYPGHRDFPQVDEVFSAASHQYILYGMGFETHARQSATYAKDAEKARELFIQNSKKVKLLLRQLPENRALLTGIGENGLPVAE